MQGGFRAKFAAKRRASPRDIANSRDGCGLICSHSHSMRPQRMRVYLQMIEEQVHRERLITLADRSCDRSIPLVFRRDDSPETETHRALLEGGRSEGFLPYRMAIDAMDWVIRPETPFWQLVGKIKSVFDPNEIIAPGRYAP